MIKGALPDGFDALSLNIQNFSGDSRDSLLEHRENTAFSDILNKHHTLSIASGDSALEVSSPIEASQQDVSNAHLLNEGLSDVRLAYTADEPKTQVVNEKDVGTTNAPLPSLNHFSVLDLSAGTEEKTSDASLYPKGIFSAPRPSFGIVAEASDVPLYQADSFSVPNPSAEMRVDSNNSPLYQKESFSVPKPPIDIETEPNDSPLYQADSFSVPNPPVGIEAEVNDASLYQSSHFSVPKPSLGIATEANDSPLYQSDSFSVPNPSMDIEAEVNDASLYQSSHFSVPKPSLGITTEASDVPLYQSDSFSVPKPPVGIEIEANDSPLYQADSFSVPKPSMDIEAEANDSPLYQSDSFSVPKLPVGIEAEVSDSPLYQSDSFSVLKPSVSVETESDDSPLYQSDSFSVPNPSVGIETEAKELPLYQADSFSVPKTSSSFEVDSSGFPLDEEGRFSSPKSPVIIDSEPSESSLFQSRSLSVPMISGPVEDEAFLEAQAAHSFSSSQEMSLTDSREVSVETSETHFDTASIGLSSTPFSSLSLQNEQGISDLSTSGQSSDFTLGNIGEDAVAKNEPIHDPLSPVKRDQSLEVTNSKLLANSDRDLSTDGLTLVQDSKELKTRHRRTVSEANPNHFSGMTLVQGSEKNGFDQKYSPVFSKAHDSALHHFGDERKIQLTTYGYESSLPISDRRVVQPGIEKTNTPMGTYSSRTNSLNTDSLFSHTSHDFVQSGEQPTLGEFAPPKDSIAELSQGEKDPSILTSLPQASSMPEHIEVSNQSMMTNLNGPSELHSSVGIAQASNSEAPTHRNVQAMRLPEHLESQILAGKEKVYVRLDPPELGELEIEIKVKDRGVHLNIVAQDGESISHLESGLASLRERLAEKGLKLDSFDIDQREDQSQPENEGRHSSNEDGKSKNGNRVFSDRTHRKLKQKRTVVLRGHQEIDVIA